MRRMAYIVSLFVLLFLSSFNTSDAASSASCQQVNDCSHFVEEFACGSYSRECMWSGSGPSGRCVPRSNFSCSNYNSNWYACNETYRCDWIEKRVDISVSPSSVPWMGTTQISWSASGVDSCTASGAWSGSKSRTGTETSSRFIAGGKTFTLTCTGIGGSISESASASMFVIPSSPDASISGPTYLEVGQTGSWDFSASDDDGDLSRWRFYASTNPNPRWSPISGTSQSGSYSTSFSSPGTYTWIIEAEDSRGVSDSDSISVSVTENAPVDVCPNISGAQTTVPEGKYINSSGNCVNDPWYCFGGFFCGGGSTNPPVNPPSEPEPSEPSEPEDPPSNPPVNPPASGGGNGGGSGSGGGGSSQPQPEPGFTVSADSSSAQIQFLGQLGAISTPRRIDVNPFSGFSNIVTLRVIDIRSTRTGSSVPEGTEVTYSFGNKEFASNPVTVLAYDSSIGAYRGEEGLIGSNFRVSFSKPVTDSYNVTLRGTGGGLSSEYTITVMPQSIDPSYEEI